MKNNVGGPATPGANVPWAAVYFSCACVSFLRGGHCWWRPMLCIDPYFLEAWLLNDRHGFRARELLGVITHALFPGGPDVVVLSIVAVAVCIIVVAALVRILYVQSTTVWGRLAIAVLVASPLCALFFQVAGDPLTFVFAAFLVAAFLIREDSPASARIVVTAAFCLLAVALHEAAIFLFFPALVLVAFPGKRGPNWVAFIKYLAIAAPALILVVLSHTASLPDPSYRAFNPLTGAVIPHLPDPFPSYTVLLQQELTHHFGTPLGLLKFLVKFPLVWCMPFLGLALVSGVILRQQPYRMMLLLNWLFLSLCSVPLYVIARDWGRFSGYTFWLTMLVTWSRRHAAPSAETVAPAMTLRKILPETTPPEGILLGILASLMLGASAVYPDNLIWGMPIGSLPIVAAVVVAWACWRAWSRSNSHQELVGEGNREVARGVTSVTEASQR
jgi:hypothetical protein